MCWNSSPLMELYKLQAGQRKIIAAAVDKCTFRRGFCNGRKNADECTMPSIA